MEVKHVWVNCYSIWITDVHNFSTQSKSKNIIEIEVIVIINLSIVMKSLYIIYIFLSNKASIHTFYK
jgi:hypothetical protein